MRHAVRSLILPVLLVLGALGLAQAVPTQTINGNLRVIDTLKVNSMMGVGTRMVVTDANGVTSTQSIPAGGSLANPSATIGLSPVNGSATSGLRSDGAPALSQAIVPTWTGAHTWAAACTFQALLTGQNALYGVTDNASNVFLVRQGSDNYVALTTSNGSEALSLGNATTNPAFNFLGSGTITATPLAGTGTRLLQANSSGALARSSIDPANLPTGLANPTGTIGLSAVNGSATTGLRSDGAPALSQAIVPTWTGAHTFNAATALNAAVSINSTLLVTGQVTNNQLTGTGTRFMTSTSGGILGNATTIAGDYTLSGNYIFGDSIQASDLAGSGTRMVVASAVGGLSTQTIPSGSSLANPSATIGLSAVNGSATSGLRSDGAPALSQAIIPTWTGKHTFSNLLQADSNSLFTDSLLVSYPVIACDAGDCADHPQAVATFRNTATGTQFGSGNTMTRVQILSPDTGRGAAKPDSVSGAYLALASSSSTDGNSWGAALAFERAGRFDYTTTLYNSPIPYSANGIIWQYSAATGAASRFTSYAAVTDVQDFNVSDSANVSGYLKHGPTIKTRATITSSSGTLEIDASLSDFYITTLTEDVTVSTPTNCAAGRHFTLRAYQDGTGGRDITWSSGFEFPSTGAPTQDTSPGGWSYYSFICNEVEGSADYVGSAIGFGGS